MLRMIFVSRHLPFGAEWWAVRWSIIVSTVTLLVSGLVTYVLGLMDIPLPYIATAPVVATAWFGTFRKYDVTDVTGIAIGVLFQSLGVLTLIADWLALEGALLVCFGFLILLRFWSVGPSDPSSGSPSKPRRLSRPRPEPEVRGKTKKKEEKGGKRKRPP